jgi:hypothetical protein
MSRLSFRKFVKKEKKTPFSFYDFFFKSDLDRQWEEIMIRRLERLHK